MLLLDTNVVSEAMKPAPAPMVAAWLSGADIRDLYLSSITVMEIGYGIGLLPPGRRRSALDRQFREMVEAEFAGRVLGFDDAAAAAAADIRARRRRGGLADTVEDSMIAGIAKIHGATVVTRNERDFLGTEIELLNPWAPEGGMGG